MYIHVSFHWSLERSVLCEVRAKVEETVDALKVTTETDRVVCEVPAEAEETADYL